MKVSFITFQRASNYGALLQTFATQEKLKEYSDDVEVIDYLNPEHRFPGVVKIRFRRGLLVGLQYIPSFLKWRAVIKRFCKQYLNLSPGQYKTEEELTSFPLHDGLFCTGSDQVWNPLLSGCDGILLPYLLSFVPDANRRFSYSASFGTGRIAQEIVDKTKPLMSLYTKVSVRESGGEEILRKQYGIEDVTRLVDPTLAMPPEFWRKHTLASRCEKNSYILMYTIHHDKDFDKYAEEMSKRAGLQVIRLCTSFVGLFEYGKSVFIPDVFSFVTLIDNARYILTDSFHGIAFSLNLGKEPVCLQPKKHPDRVQGFLKLVGAEDRMIKDYRDFDLIDRPVDFERVNRILEQERRRVDDFLVDVFSFVPERNGGMDD